MTTVNAKHANQLTATQAASASMAHKSTYVAPRITVIGNMHDTEGKKSAVKGSEGPHVIVSGFLTLTESPS